MKSQMSNPDKNRIIFFQIGLIVGLAAVLGAFEWKSQPRELSLDTGMTIIIDEDPIIKIKVKEEKKVDKKKLEPLNLKIVEDDKKTEDITVNAEADQNSIVDYDVNIKLNEEERVEDPIIKVPEFNAEFHGGLNEMFKFLRNNIIYPEEDKINGIEGIVYLTFVVEKDGSITNIQVLRGISHTLDNEAIRVLKKMPKWKPGQQGIEKVRVQFNLPISFKLQ